MTAYWVQFVNGEKGCVEANSVDGAKKIGERIKSCEINRIDAIPYPANPRLYKHVTRRAGTEYSVPSFCVHPEKCLGRNSCPRDLACND